MNTSKFLRIALAAVLVVSTLPVARAQAPAPEAVDALIDKLVQVNPAELAVQLGTLKEQATAHATEATALTQKAVTLEQEATSLEGRVNALMAHVQALAAAFGMAAPAPPAEPAAMAAAAPAPAPEAEMMAKDTPKEFTNFDEHIKPIFQARCVKCHGDDSKKSGLSVATFAAIMQGGSGGASIEPGNADNSRLFKLITKAEEPYMPPSGDPLPPEQIELIRKWINDGALQNSSSTPMAKAETSTDSAEAFVAATFSDSPPMPEAALGEAAPWDGRAVVARAIDANPRSPLLAVGSNRQVLLYNIDTYALLGALPFPEGDVYTMTFSIDGEYLLAGGGEEGNTGLGVLWNVRTGQRLGTYGEMFDTVLAADISPDNRMIAIGGPNKKVRVYATDTKQELYVLEAHSEWIQAVKFTPDGEVLASADRAGNLFLWQAANGRQVEQLRGHEGAIYSLAYTPDSALLASAGKDGTVRLWDTWTYKQARSIKAHNMQVLHVDIGPDSRILTTSAENSAKIWDIAGTELKAFTDLKDWSYQAAFNSDGKTVAAGNWAGDVLVWNGETGEVMATLKTNPAAVPPKMAAAQ